MTGTEENRIGFEKKLSELLYRLLGEKLFTALGLELSATVINFFSNEDFPLRGTTFAFFNPIDNSLNINLEAPFFTKAELPGKYQKTRDPEYRFSLDNELFARLFFILFHEAGHKLLLHSQRRAGRSPALWNAAADYEIHNLLYLYCEICREEPANELRKECILVSELLDYSASGREKPDPEKGQYQFLFSQLFLADTAEEIYRKLEKTKQVRRTSFKVRLPRMMKNAQHPAEKQPDPGVEVTITETTFTLPDGAKYTSVDYDWPELPQLSGDARESQDRRNDDRNNTHLRKQMMEHELRSAITRRGTLSQNCLTFVKKLLTVRVDWGKILKLSLQTILCRSDYCTWARPRPSMYALDVYLPDIEKDSDGYGVLVIARDESGSMSDEQIAKCGAIIAEAKEHYRKIIILKHDVRIQYRGEFEELSDEVLKMLCTRNVCGGTSHREVFEFIANYAKEHPGEEDRISCVILLTDGWSDILQTQDLVPGNIPLVYLVPQRSRTTGFRGKIIPIDL